VTQEEVAKGHFQQIPSTPFQIDFPTPVSQVFCGDQFSGLLTVTGKVFTWGSNSHG